MIIEMLAKVAKAGKPSVQATWTASKTFLRKLNIDIGTDTLDKIQNMVP
jgi:hypothetical protein